MSKLIMKPLTVEVTQFELSNRQINITHVAGKAKTGGNPTSKKIYMRRLL